MNKAAKSAVVDASYVLSILLPDENFVKDGVPTKMFAPNILDYEIISALKSAVVSKRISEKLAISLFSEYQNLPISKKTVDFNQVLTLALKHKLSIYDASYLLLAKDLQLNLFTLDKQLQKVLQVSSST
jgi:predicted nucleic acid-binding protein